MQLRVDAKGDPHLRGMKRTSSQSIEELLPVGKEILLGKALGAPLSALQICLIAC